MVEKSISFRICSNTQVEVKVSHLNVPKGINSNSIFVQSGADIVFNTRVISGWGWCAIRGIEVLTLILGWIVTCRKMIPAIALF